MSMKQLPYTITLALFLMSAAPPKGVAQESWYSQYVQLKGYNLYGSSEPLWLILINKSENHIKTKYFAYPSLYSTVPEKFNSWKRNKKVILYASGSYVSNLTSTGTPVGLTIDNGVAVNRNIETKGYDGLVVISPAGEIDVLDLKYVITFQGEARQYDIQHNQFDKNDFIQWAVGARYTVFQTHLLAYKNQICLSQYNSSTTTASNRRFLACGTNSLGQTIHVIVNDLHSGTLYARAKLAFDVLQNQEGLNIAWMINLDTGAKDIFQAYNEQGDELIHYKGSTSFNEAINLIAYYYE
jgi:hypothetical protein